MIRKGEEKKSLESIKIFISVKLFTQQEKNVNGRKLNEENANWSLIQPFLSLPSHCIHQCGCNNNLRFHSKTKRI